LVLFPEDPQDDAAFCGPQMKISIDAQVTALQEAVTAHRSYVRAVRRLVAEKERPKEILEDTERRLPAMEAALKTLQWVQKNRDTIVQVYEKAKTPP
jgi:hypothetical protein